MPSSNCRPVAAPARDSSAGERYVTALIDLGRPPIAGLVEPDRELAALKADFAALGGVNA